MPRFRPFWTLDCESDPFKAGRIPEPFIWGIYGGPSREEYHEFLTGLEVVNFCEERCRGQIVYAHNGGKFDYHYLRDWINTGEPISVIAGRLSRFRIGECEFRDSMNILPVSLATFKKDDFDYTILEREVRHEPKNWEKIRKYLRSDCVNLYELIDAHRKENGVVLTQASASMRAWSRDSRIKPPKQTGAAFQLYKPYYYGGRVQCFSHGTMRRKFKVIDINSAYPEAMLRAHPFSPKGSLQSKLPKDSELHKCMVTLTCTTLKGCFPLRIEEGPEKGALYFPVGHRARYHVTGYELIAALKFDAIKDIKIESVYVFAETVKFEDFITKNWTRRARAKVEGNKALDIIVKLLMNSLYGKFASDYNKYREYQVAWIDDMAERAAEGYIEEAIFGKDRRLISRPIPEEKHRFYNIVTAASITGFVRAKLFEALEQVADPIYCDTDSIACVDTGKLKLGDGLGEWKVEGEFDEYAITGKKMYAFHKKGAPENDELDDKKNYAHYKVACKGVDLAPSEIRIAAGGRSVTYSPEVPTYSLKRETPVFVSRDVKLTAKDIRKVPA